MNIRKPFFIVNPKSYIFGDDVLKLAKLADELAQKYDIDCIFTGQLIDLPMIKKATKNLIITAQFMDSLTPGRGMGHVLPEALKNQGVEAVVLNHAEKQLTLTEIARHCSGVSAHTILIIPTSFALLTVLSISVKVNCFSA